jgi:alpha-glucosidase
MNHFFKIIFIASLNSLVLQANSQNYEVTSPDKKIKINILIGNSISYSVKYKDKYVILPSVISMSVHSGVTSRDIFKVNDTVTHSVNNKIIPVVKGRESVINDNYKELIIRFNSRFDLNFRIYNDAVAYRFTTDLSGEITVTDEEANFNFPSGTVIWYPQITKRTEADIFHTSFEEQYSFAKIDTLPVNMFAFSPVLLQPEGLPKVLITESDVADYPGMFLINGQKCGLIGSFAGYPVGEVETKGGFRQKIVTERAPFIAKTKGPRKFPWRVIAIAPTDGSLLMNQIVYKLASDPAFSDFSWIKPGKSTEEWITGLNLYDVDFKAGLNTETYKYYIDFAARFGFEYVMLDAGWSDVNDLFSITPGMDMEEITGYAGTKGIGLILWTQALTIEKQMDKALQQFKKWDIKIVMTDFIDRNDQVANNFLTRFASECAKNKFMCMIHGAPVPAGFQRTFPNMVAREAVLGSEYNAWSSKANPDHDLKIPFIRMFSGPMDYEPGILQNATKDQTVKMGFEKVIAQGTRMHQIAMFVVYESPLQLFSGNLSDGIHEPELMTFLGKIPTTWDQTIILDASLGKYIVEARRNGDIWYIAAMNSWTPEEFSVPLNFLEDGKYSVEVAADGINADRNPEDFKLSKTEVSSNDSLKIKLAPGGGFVARILKK